MRKLKILKMGNKGVSEVVGTLLLLTISVSLFSVIYASIFSIEISEPTPTVDIIGSINDNELILNHQGGDDLDLDTEVIISVNGKNTRLPISQNLSYDEKQDDYWNIGEIFNFSLEMLPPELNYQRFQAIDVTVADKISNSAVMSGVIIESRFSDLVMDIQVTQGSTTPQVGDKIKLKFIVKNFGPSVVKDVEVEIKIPDILHYLETSPGFDGLYDLRTGIWEIDNIASSTNAIIEMKYLVCGIPDFPTQLALVVDGSNKISNTNFDRAINGIADAVKFGFIPNDKFVELTVIQYGGDADINFHLAEVEFGPAVISDNPMDPNYYDNVQSSIRTISKKGGACSMACGIRLSADTLYASSEFHPKKRQIINLVSAGLPDYICQYPAGVSPHSVSPMISAEAQRNYLIDKLLMREGFDEIDCEVFTDGFSEDQLVYWLKTKIIFPNIYSHHHFVPNPGGPGWLIEVEAGDDFADILAIHFKNVFKTQTVSAEIISCSCNDIDLSNNIFELTIGPTPVP